MDKLWDLDVEIQLAASQIDRGLEIFIISEPSGATRDVLYDAVHPFQNGIRMGALEVVQDRVPMIADRAERFLFLSLFFRQIGIILQPKVLGVLQQDVLLGFHLANLVFYMLRGYILCLGNIS